MKKRKTVTTKRYLNPNNWITAAIVVTLLIPFSYKYQQDNTINYEESMTTHPHSSSRIQSNKIKEKLEKKRHKDIKLEKGKGIDVEKNHFLGSSFRNDDDENEDNDYVEASNKNRKFTLEDIMVGRFYKKGSVNHVCEVVLPDWWYEQFDDDNDYIMKWTTSLHEESVIEINALDKFWSDERKARQLKIMPMAYGKALVDNPFYKGLKPQKKIPSSWEKGRVTKLRETRQITALIVPYYDLEQIDVLDSLPRLQSFMRSLLETLSYAHSLGLNMLDISNSNIRVDTEDDTAIIIDWNAGKALGEDIYEPEANFYQTPPEAMIEHVDGKMIQQTSISAFDVWASGIMFAYLLFRGSECTWMNPKTHKKREKYPEWKDYLKTLVLSFGGDTNIPISDDVGDKVDLASLVGVKKRDMVDGKKTIQLPLFKSDAHGKVVRCEKAKLPNGMGSKSAQRQALSFLKSMMIINPAERPTCDELLLHPFMKITDFED